MVGALHRPSFCARLRAFSTVPWVTVLVGLVRVGHLERALYRVHIVTGFIILYCILPRLVLMCLLNNPG